MTGAAIFREASGLQWLPKCNLRKQSLEWWCQSYSWLRQVYATKACLVIGPKRGNQDERRCLVLFQRLVFPWSLFRNAAEMAAPLAA